MPMLNVTKAQSHLVCFGSLAAGFKLLHERLLLRAERTKSVEKRTLYLGLPLATRKRPQSSQARHFRFVPGTDLMRRGE